MELSQIGWDEGQLCDVQGVVIQVQTMSVHQPSNHSPSTTFLDYSVNFATQLATYPCTNVFK